MLKGFRVVRDVPGVANPMSMTKIAFPTEGAARIWIAREMKADVARQCRVEAVAG
jgi:hypothetical protein